VRCRDTEGGVDLGFSEVDRTRVEPALDGVCSVSDLVDARELRGFVVVGVLGGGVAVDLVGATRDDKDFADAEVRSAGDALAVALLVVGVPVLVRGAAARVTGVLAAAGVVLVAAVDLAIAAAPEGSAGAGEDVPGALDRVLVEDSVRVRSVGVDFEVGSPSADGRGVGLVVFAAVVVLVAVAVEVEVVGLAAAGLAAAVVFVAALEGPALADAVMLELPALCALEVELAVLTEPEVIEVRGVLTGAFAAAVGVFGTAGFGVVDFVVVVAADLADVEVLAVAADLTEAMDVWCRNAGLDFCGRRTGVDCRCRRGCDGPASGVEGAGEAVSRLVPDPDATLDAVVLPVRSGRGGPVMTFVGVGGLAPVRDDEARPLALPTDTIGVLLAAVGLRAMGPDVGCSRRAATDTGRDVDLDDMTDDVDAELERRRRRSPLGWSVESTGERTVDARLASDVRGVRAGALLDDTRGAVVREGPPGKGTCRASSSSM